MPILNSQEDNRLSSLDYLRGLMAFGIMIYHYSSWTTGAFTSESFLGRIGVYGVSVFYILSGLTLYYVYHDKMGPTKADLIDFYKKRFFRIYPLLWLATIASVIIAQKASVLNLLSNLTGLFGLFRWYSYYATGAWSIGNELVFYLFFPVFIFLKNKNKIYLAIFALLIFSVFLYFAFRTLTSHQSLELQWRNYVNPLNQVFLFISGCLVAYIFFKTKVPKAINVIIFFIGILLFIFYPSSGDDISLVTGVNRLVFTLCAILICFSFFKNTIYFPSFIDKPLALLGKISYSVYLIHPLVYKIANIILPAQKQPSPVWLIPGICIFITLCISYIVYEKFERYFMRLGRAVKTLPEPAK